MDTERYLEEIIKREETIWKLREELQKEKRLPVKMNYSAFVTMTILSLWKIVDTLWSVF